MWGDSGVFLGEKQALQQGQGIGDEGGGFRVFCCPLDVIIECIDQGGQVFVGEG